MALIVEDRVVETSTTTGTGAFALSGAPTGFRTFASVCAVADTVYYTIEGIDVNGVLTGDWETGLGTYSAANTLTRTTVNESSNAGAAVNFASGSKRVFLSPSVAYVRSLEEWAPNFTAAGDLYIPAREAMTIGQGNAAIGTGTLTYTKSTAALPSTFGAATLPVTLEAGAWLKIAATAVTGFVATHLKRTA